MQTDLHQFDQRQREIALNPTESFIVQAPAGSGKTELLIQRYLTLLANVSKPEEILSITFTKKAANEMRHRVIKALKSAQWDPEPTSPHAKKTWLIARRVLERDQQLNWQIANNPNQLRMQTIDSLCSSLTKSLPLLARFGAQPTIAGNQDPLFVEAVRNVLFHIEEEYEWSSSIATLLLHLDNDLNKLLDLLVGMLKQRDQWQPYVTLDNQTDLKVVLEGHLQAMVEDALHSIQLLMPPEILPELLAIARIAAGNLSRTEPESALCACLDIQVLEVSCVDLPKWRGITNLLLTEDKNEAHWRKSVTKKIGFPAPSESKNPKEKAELKEHKDRITALLNKLSDYPDFQAALHELKYMPDPYYAENQWDMLKALFQVLKVCTLELRKIFQQDGLIDFIENSQAAISALGDVEQPTNLAAAMDHEIKHILVDEFQDTSLTQYKLLEKLIASWQPNDGRTLFIVGDPMQSIYRFREAEVGIFIRMWESGIGRIKLTPLVLSVNFRSTASIIEWNNEHFKQLFPTVNSIATGSVTYTSSAPHLGALHNSPDSFIKIDGFVNASDTVMAEHIATTITQLNQQFPGESIAILVRSRSALKTIIPMLKQYHIAYNAVEIDALSSRQLIQDLFALTRALLHPADRIAWLSVLRAPWCGLLLQDIHTIVHSQSHGDILTQLATADLNDKLSDDGKLRLARLIPVLAWAISQRQRYSLRTWVETVWLQLGGPACLQNENALEDANTFFNLLDNVERDNDQVDFTILKQSIRKLFASSSHADCHVHLMTIHNSKGLEFHSVILPHLQAKTPSDDKRLLLWMDRPLANDKTALLLAPINATGDNEDRLYNFIKRQLKIKLEYEVDRLLYVATTRAKKRLYMTFNVARNEDNIIRVEPGSFLKKCWPLFSNSSLMKLSEAQKVTDENLISQSLPAKMICRLNSNWVHPFNILPPAPYHAYIPEHGFNLPDDHKKIIGIVAHYVFQQIARYGFDWWQTKETVTRNVYLQRQLYARGFTIADAEKNIALLNNIINNTCEDARGRWILSAHREAKSEYAITAIIKYKIQAYVIDRTFVDDEDVRWIVDYKTAALAEGQSLEDFLAEESATYRDQLLHYYQAFKSIETRDIRLGLYFPAIPAWQEVII